MQISKLEALFLFVFQVHNFFFFVLWFYNMLFLSSWVNDVGDGDDVTNVDLFNICHADLIKRLQLKIFSFTLLFINITVLGVRRR